jgi:hypothetical protein
MVFHIYALLPIYLLFTYFLLYDTLSLVAFHLFGTQNLHKYVKIINITNSLTPWLMKPGAQCRIHKDH